MSRSYNRAAEFLADKKVTTSGRSSSSSNLQQSLSDCCYSFANLIIIFACVIGLFFTVKFINDDPLYDYGEHLLTLRFYRQLIYIIVVFPLIVLVPLFNAASACFSKSSLGPPSLIAKITYQILVALLSFIALVFLAPSIRYSNLVKQIDFEFKRHMKFRYEKDFSYEFIDRIQREYDCCDDDWYRSNYNDKIPLSCYGDDLDFIQIRTQTCPEAIGSIVSTRCGIIAACLVAILIALAILVALDILKLISAKENYDVRAREHALIANSPNSGGPSINAANRSPSFSRIASPNGNTASLNDSDNDDNSDDDDNDDGGFKQRLRQQQQQQQQRFPNDQNRLRSDERHRERPLLNDNSGRTTPLAEPEPDFADSDYLNNSGPSPGARSPAAILTNAKYISHPPGNRPKSPVVFVSNNTSRSSSSSPTRSGRGDSNNPPSPAPPRGVLKKTSSLSRTSMDRDSLVSGRDNNMDDDLLDEEFESYQRQLQQSLQNQRPLFNVRFAE